jgi:hypothetical protein
MKSRLVVVCFLLIGTVVGDDLPTTPNGLRARRHLNGGHPTPNGLRAHKLDGHPTPNGIRVNKLEDLPTSPRSFKV